MSWLDTLEDIRTKDFAKVPAKKRDDAARDVINMTSYGCAMVAVSPIPFSDAVLSLPMQTGMVMTIGHIYGRKVTKADAASLIVELGAVAGAGMLARQGIKALLPMVGALLTVPAAYAMNWAIGRVVMEYFQHPNLPKEQLKKIFDTAKKEGSKLFSKERFEAFRRQQAGKEAKQGKEAKAPAKKAPKAGKPTKVERLITKDFGARLTKHPEVRKAIDGVIHLDITGRDGGQWTADLTRDEDFFREGLTGKPKLTVRCSADQFGALVKGRKDARTAVLAGELELVPMDLELVSRLSPLFS